MFPGFLVIRRVVELLFLVGCLIRNNHLRTLWVSASLNVVLYVECNESLVEPTSETFVVGVLFRQKLTWRWFVVLLHVLYQSLLNHSFELVLLGFCGLLVL